MNDVNISNGRGIASFLKDKPGRRETIEDQNMQIEKLSVKNVDIIQVYRSSNGRKRNLIENIASILNHKMMTLIIGDLNICSKSEPEDEVIQFLITNGFRSLMLEPTQISGRSIDHCYISKNAKVAEIMRYSPYYSDHDALLVTL